MTLNDKEEKLEAVIKNCGASLVAFSGGVDSTLLMAKAFKILGDQLQAVTFQVESSSEDEVNAAVKIAKELGVAHQVIHLNMMKFPEFSMNTDMRCYVCKKEMMLYMMKIKKQIGFDSLMEGSNLDDLNEVRPGRKAVEEMRVISPLVEAGLTKKDVRTLARKLHLKNAEKPSTPCLATRQLPNQRLEIKKMKMVFDAETRLKNMGFQEIRVRMQEENNARIETTVESIEALFQRRMEVVDTLKNVGFERVSIDLNALKVQ